MSVVREFIEQRYSERIQHFEAGFCPLDVAEEAMDRWAKAGSMTVFMAGVFDIPTPNHRFGLAEARLMAGAINLGVDYSLLTNETSDGVLRKVMAEASSDAVRLMVSVDTDDNVAKDKAFRPEKGDSPKPIFGWDTRAYNLASYTVPRGDGTSHNMVDFVTRHRLNSCQACPDCASRDNALMVAKLQPKLVVVNTASHNTVRTVVDEKSKGLLPDTIIGLTNEQDHQFIDELLGGRVSSTAIIRRAKGIGDKRVTN